MIGCDVLLLLSYFSVMGYFYTKISICGVMDMRRLEYSSKERWNGIYKREKTLQPIQEDMPRIVDVFRKYNCKRVLDLACGSGRHILYLAEMGFDVNGIDISGEGIRIANSLLEERNLHANLIVGSIYRRLPFKDNFFDAIVCIQALHHARIESIRRTIREMERVLKPSGLAFVTVRKRIPKKERLPFKDIAPRTYIPLEGEEKGLVHYLFNKKLLHEEFKDFKIHDIWVDSKNYYCLLGELERGT